MNINKILNLGWLALAIIAGVVGLIKMNNILIILSMLCYIASLIHHLIEKLDKHGG